MGRVDLAPAPWQRDLPTARASGRLSEDVIPLMPLPKSTLPLYRRQATPAQLAKLTNALTRFMTRDTRAAKQPAC